MFRGPDLFCSCEGRNGCWLDSGMADLKRRLSCSGVLQLFKDWSRILLHCYSLFMASSSERPKEVVSGDSGFMKSNSSAVAHEMSGPEMHYTGYSLLGL